MKREFFEHEEDFHSQNRKQFRKQRRHLTETDRSQFKKTDALKPISGAPFDALPRGRVVSISGEGFWVELEGAAFLCSLKGALKKESVLVKNLVTVGDFVRLEENCIAHIEARSSTLARTEIRGQKEQLIAANVDQVLIVVSLVQPPLKPALIDRYLIAARKGRNAAIIVVNKFDLLKASSDEEERYREFIAAYEPLGVPLLTVSTRTGTGIDSLRALMQGKTSVLAGQSGVGKSSLLNATFGLVLKTGELAKETSKGTHTTTSASLLALPGGGYCVDTPGIRSFGVWQLKRDDVMEQFHDLEKRGGGCRFQNCAHTQEPGCGVLRALKEGEVPLLRYESYLALLGEAVGGMDNRMRRKGSS